MPKLTFYWRSEETGTVKFLKDSADRIILLDSAVVLFVKGDLQLPEVPIAMLPLDEPCDTGNEIGWLGYPAIEPHTLCFFSGTVSARPASHKAYLIDGVAINGVSGGPVFHVPRRLLLGEPHGPKILGCVSAYHPNRATGEALPGLLRAQDVSHFHAAASRVRSWDEANAKKHEFEAAQAQKTSEADPTTDEGGGDGGMTIMQV